MRRLFCLFLFLAEAGVIAAPPPYDLIFSHGRVVDGTGKAAFEADVAVRGDRIVRIGKLAKEKAKRRIEARGLVIAPGFIDMLGQSEQNLLVDPRAMSKVMMGVTTEITGEGDSIAPMTDRIAAENADFYKRYGVKVDWHTLGEYFARLEKQGMGVNLGTYVGAAAVRENVIGYENRKPSPEELARMRGLVESSLRDGALGISTALQYVPGRFATTDEIVSLAETARAGGGIYATHQRSESNAIDESLDEVFEIARRAKIPVEIFHLKTAYRKNWGRMPQILGKIAKARAEGLDITADVYPYIAANTALAASLPPWALEGGIEATLRRLADRETREKIKEAIGKDSREWENIYLGSGGPSGVMITEVTNPKLEKYAGKRISEIATSEKRDPLDVLFDIVTADHGLTYANYFVMDEADLKMALAAPYVTICTDSPARAIDGPLSSGNPHPRGWGAFPRVLARYVREQKLLTLEQAIHKMTGQPAARFRLKDRGVLAEGAYADITVFDPMIVKDKATFASPKQYAEGIPYVAINGQLAVDHGRRTKALSGKVLRGSSDGRI